MDTEDATQAKNVALHKAGYTKTHQTSPELINSKKLFEQRFNLVSHGKLHANNINSVGTMSNSDTKSHSTTFSAPAFDFTMRSSSASTPTTSRAQSPARRPKALHEEMELDLVGIGDQIKPSTSNTDKGRLPIRSHNTRLSEWHLSQDGSQTPMQTVDSVYTGTTVDIPVDFPDSDSGSASDIGDFDFDLERTASIALSRCFGVSLDRLSRPLRVVDAFSGFKNQCAEILRQEESFTTIDWDDDGFSCFDVEEGGVKHTEHAHGRTSGQAQQSKSRPNKRPFESEGRGDGFGDSDIDSNHGQTPGRREPSKRQRTASRYSCPFRKRNPRRFNVRNHYVCANVPYPNISQLK